MTLDKNTLITIINNLEESVFVTDGDGKVILVNPLATKLLGVSAEDMLGHYVKELIEKGYWSNSSVLKAISTKATAISPINCITGSKNISTSVPVIDDNGNIELIVTNSSGEKSLINLYKILEREKKGKELYKREIEYLRLQKEKKIIAESDSIKFSLKEALAASRTDNTVIISGESGAGKDVVANYMHSKSKRANYPFIDINCAAIPDNLFEAELFGYEKGAFTGANSNGKMGLLDVAKDGTVFLDEIGELSMFLQAKLLRVLENKVFRRVGGTENIKITSRFICATNKDLKKLVDDGKFRGDLFYRLNEFSLNVDPLRCRVNDIIPLAEYFLKEYNEKYGTSKHLSDNLKEAMKAYAWPGNTRELRNVISRAYVVAEGDELKPDDILIHHYNFESSSSSKVSPLDYYVKQQKTLKEFRDEMELKYIEEVLESCDGNKAKAAEILGIHRSHIYRRLSTV